MNLDIISDFVAKFNMGRIRKVNIIKIKKTKISFKLLTILYNEGYISNFIIKKNFFFVFLPIKNCFIKFYRYSTSGNRIFLSYLDLLRSHKNEVLILSTSQGLILTNVAIKKKIGGEPIIKII